MDTCQNKESADQYHVTISRPQVFRAHPIVFFKLTADQVLVFDWIAGSYQVNTGSGLKVNRNIPFSSIQMFLTAFVLCMY